MSGFWCKEFFVGHDRCAMKVGTDALLLGAWATLPKAGTALDIGAGSGILSLMLAQRLQKSGLNPLVYAVELDQDAALQAQENVAASRWAAQIHVIQADILTYAATDNQPEHGFELIIMNYLRVGYIWTLLKAFVVKGLYNILDVHTELKFYVH